MAFYRPTEDLIRRLRRLGEPLTLRDIEVVSGLTSGSTRALASRLTKEGRLEALPIRGTYAWPGWHERPYGELMVFRAWLKFPKHRGWLIADEQVWLARGTRPLDADTGELVPWRIEVISKHAEPTLAAHYRVRRVARRPPRVKPVGGVPLAF
jgi:hypothetical protein